MKLRLVDTSKLNHLKAIPLRLRKKDQSHESREEEKEDALERQSIKMANKLKVFRFKQRHLKTSLDDCEGPSKKAAARYSNNTKSPEPEDATSLAEVQLMAEPEETKKAAVAQKKRFSSALKRPSSGLVQKTKRVTKSKLSQSPGADYQPVQAEMSENKEKKRPYIAVKTKSSKMKKLSLNSYKNPTK